MNTNGKDQGPLGGGAVRDFYPAKLDISQRKLRSITKGLCLSLPNI